MANSIRKDRLVDIGITLVVLIVAVVVLGITNYQHSQQQLEVFYRQVDSDIAIFDENVANTAHLFRTADELAAAFPESNVKLNWNREALLFYVGHPQSSSGYDIKLVGADQQGQTITFKYKIVPPEPGRAYLTVITQPTLAIAINHVNLVSGGSVILRLQNVDTNQTTSLTVPTDAS